MPSDPLFNSKSIFISGKDGGRGVDGKKEECVCDSTRQ